MSYYKVAQTIEDCMANFEKRYCFQAVTWSIPHRWDSQIDPEFGEYSIWNAEEGKKEPISLVTLENYSGTRYPLLNRVKGVLVKDKYQVTMGHYYFLCTDGYYYCKKMENYTIPERKIYDDQDNLIQTIPPIEIAYDSFYTGCLFDSIVENHPERVLIDD